MFGTPSIHIHREDDVFRLPIAVDRIHIVPGTKLHQVLGRSEIRIRINLPMLNYDKGFSNAVFP